MMSRLLEKQKQQVATTDDERLLLSLGPSQFQNGSSSSLPTELDISFSTKRKNCREQTHTNTGLLHHREPLPVDWEQCLDLECGRMYYMNKNTLKKSRSYPKSEKLDLELHIATFCDTGESSQVYEYESSTISMNNTMVATACTRCHLLLMLSKSSPSCPKCKYVHTLPDQKTTKIEPTKNLETLSLLN